MCMQEHKFNHYYQRLSHVVAEHARIMGSLRSIVKPLLKPHIADLEQKLAPGLTVLSWMSLNIDGFIHMLTQVRTRRVPMGASKAIVLIFIPSGCRQPPWRHVLHVVRACFELHQRGPVLHCCAWSSIFCT